MDKCYLYGSCKCQTAGCVALPDEGCPVYRYFKGLIVKDYENRLRADMAGMLTDINMEIMKLPVHVVTNKGSIIHMEIVPSAIDAYEVIQEKINALKGEQTITDT